MFLTIDKPGLPGYLVRVLTALWLFAAALPADAGTLHGRLTGGAGDLSELVVSLEEGPSLPPVEATAADRNMYQRRKQFSPKVTAVRAGTPLRFENQDDVFHNVFSLDKRNPFDLGLYKGSTRFADDKRTPADGGEPAVTFSTAGAYPVFCNIHPDMTGTVFVLDHGYFARAGKDGAFELPVPDSGVVTLLVQGPSLAKPVRQSVTLPVEGIVEVGVRGKRFALTKPHSRKDGSQYGGAYGGRE